MTRTKSRPSRDDIEQNNNNGGAAESKRTHRESQSNRKRIMKVAAALLLVAGVITAIVASLNRLRSDDKVSNDENAANSTPSAPSASPVISPPTPQVAPNGTNNDSSSVPITVDTNSPTPASHLLPTTLIFLPLTSEPSISKPPTAAPSPKPTAAPSPKPTAAPTFPPTLTPSASPTLAPSSKDNIFDVFDEVVSPNTRYRVLNVVPHDPSAFTQGLYYDMDSATLIEGTGLYGQSLVRIWDPLTGQVQKETPVLDFNYFGEGLTWYQDANGNERFVQITWKAQTAFIYDTNLNLLQKFNYNERTTTNEGWGITFDPVERIFYVSDGSRYIHVWDLEFQLVRKFAVTWKDSSASSSGSPVTNLNELEWDSASGTILSNVWYKNYIVRIWPGTGKVIEVLDMENLKSGGGDVLNGIAKHSDNKWWITGKQWRNLYLIEIL